MTEERTRDAAPPAGTTRAVQIAELWRLWHEALVLHARQLGDAARQLDDADLSAAALGFAAAAAGLDRFRRRRLTPAAGAVAHEGGQP